MIYFGEPPPGTRWGIIVHHLGDYMRRWILRTPWGTVRVHNILRSDEDRDMHDHPFDFTSIIIGGNGYVETAPLMQLNDVSGNNRHLISPEVQHKRWPRWSVIRHKAEDLHKLSLYVPVWTLVFAGPWRRKWGFMTREGWVHWRDYVNAEPVDDPLKTHR